MATSKQTQPDAKNYLAVPAAEMGWQQFPLTDKAVCRDIEAAFEQKLAEGWVLCAAIARNVGHSKDKPFFVFRRTQ